VWKGPTTPKADDKNMDIIDMEMSDEDELGKRKHLESVFVSIILLLSIHDKRT